MFYIITKFNAKSRTEASNYTKQIYSVLSSIGKNVHNFHKEFKDLNRFSVSIRFEKCAISIMFKSINGNCSYYLNEVFEFAPEGNFSLRNNFFKLKRPFRNRNTGQKSLIFH